MKNVTLSFAMAGLLAAPLAAQAVTFKKAEDAIKYRQSTFSVMATHFSDIGAMVKGDKAFSTEYMGATFRFASAAHRDTFLANPEAYAPQYGGYCAWAVSQGYTAKGDARNWKIVDGKLYLNYNTSIQKKWEADIPGFVSAANTNWPGLVD